MGRDYLDETNEVLGSGQCGDLSYLCQRKISLNVCASESLDILVRGEGVDF